MDYKHLIGKNKKQIVAELGQDFNYYQASLWFYILGKDWLGRTKILRLYFNEDMVIKIEVKTSYGHR